MTTIHLVRHAVHDLIAHTLVGRNPDVRLSATGAQQARALAAHFSDQPLTCIQCSPQPRARATAEPIAEAHGLQVRIAIELDEIDMGGWSGRSFAELQENARWRQWNEARSTARPPGGESMEELQRRAVRHLARMRTEHPEGCIAVVTHAELIRAVALRALGRPLDDWASVTIDPASVTTLHSGDQGITINRRVEELVAA